MSGLGEYAAHTAVVVLMSACSGAQRTSDHTAQLGSIDEVVQWQRDLRLEENQQVINVSPWVQPDGSGKFLVADGMEQQIRAYGADGRLHGIFGRRGSGPGEFQHLVRSVRLPDGSILAPDMMGQLTRFDSAGQRVLSTARTGIGPIYDIAILDDSSVLIVGRKGGESEGPLLHEWSVRNSRLLSSFFPAPQGRRGFAGAYAFTGFADVAVRGDTLAAIFALEDTVRVFTRDGRALAKIPIPFANFHALEKPLPANRPPQEFQEWLGSFSTATDVFWLDDGTFLIQYMDQHASDRMYSLLHMDRAGRKLWEVTNAPRLLAVAAADSLVFVKKGAEAPNEWSIAKLSVVR